MTDQNFLTYQDTMDDGNISEDLCSEMDSSIIMNGLEAGSEAEAHN